MDQESFTAFSVGQHGSLPECLAYVQQYYLNNRRRLAGRYGNKELKRQIETALFTQPSGYRSDPPPFYYGQEYDLEGKPFLNKSLPWEASAHPSSRFEPRPSRRRHVLGPPDQWPAVPN
ncbi:uncharacterized protein LOC106011371 [Aplysia californica]|uniref:Uncharacterized protein LOC106011371 n=1 Tax=Aplysia californica TaxID=6500 RepID=A0ABM0ZWX9_APLCA|nr:uncharacterized protein LOC106011371 [Aplysia californica]